ncbi:MAG: hypothetical protein HQ501_03900 [Rhodospirillales bacterium]|nr:hypothetical protein [Rhodospirillales bacterium]
MKKRTTLALLVAVIGIGGYWAYGSYQEHQRMKAWESLMEGDDCDVCSARKAALVKNVEERKARAETEAEQAQ